MHKDYKHDPQLSISTGYEVSDINTRAIITFAIIVAIVGVLVLPITAMIIRTLQDTRPPESPRPLSPLAGHIQHIPLDTLLQTEPQEDARREVGAARAHLEIYGIVVDEPGEARAHIPIGRALELMAEGRLPYRQTPEAPEAMPLPQMPAPPLVPAPQEPPASPQAPEPAPQAPADTFELE